jgi:hypothetical protein
MNLLIHLSIKPFGRKGVVGWIKQTASNSNPFFFNSPKQYNTVSTVGLLSVERCPGLRKGTCPPHFLASSAISSVSVDTIVLEIKLDFAALSKEYAMRGLHPRYLMFFLGTPLEPPRAGISPSILIENYDSNSYTKL